MIRREDALPFLVQMICTQMNSDDVNTRRDVAAMMEYLTKGHICMLKAMLSDPNVTVVDAAVTALANIQHELEGGAR